MEGRSANPALRQIQTVLEQIEARSAFDHMSLGNNRQSWMIAWALVDLEKAETLVDSVLASL